MADSSPLGHGDNWVTRVGGLPAYIREIAHALIRSGHSESEAIQLAIGTVQRWARGGSHVKADTQAKATAALAEWNAKKARSHVKEAAQMPTTLTESTPLSEAATTISPGQLDVTIITPGWGSSGYYSPEVLEAAVGAGLISKGTPMYLDHASQSDRADRPERSVRDIAAVFTEEARWTGNALVARAQVFSPYRELLTEMAPHIGVSISGSATDVVLGEVDGRSGPIVEGLAEISSVDFVTRAGRGGKAAVIESALQSADAAFRTVLHEGLHRNVPVSPAGSTTKSQGGTMPDIEEARLRQLETDAGRVSVLESERDTAISERDAIARALAQANAREAAVTRVRASLTEAHIAGPLAERIVAVAVASVPLTDAGQLDEAALDATVTTVRAAEEAYAASLTQGNGTVRDMGGAGLLQIGGAPSATNLTEASLDNIIAGAFGRQVKEA